MSDEIRRETFTCRPDEPRNHVLVSSVTLAREGIHDVLHVFNRGGHSGRLVCRGGDGAEIASRLIPDAESHALGELRDLVLQIVRGQGLWCDDARDAVASDLEVCATRLGWLP
jgi:hypothetical protein